MHPFREFFYLVAGGAMGSLLGAGFGGLVAGIAPDFMQLLTHPIVAPNPERIGIAMGMILGLMIGAMAMFAARLIGGVQMWANRESHQTLSGSSM